MSKTTKSAFSDEQLRRVIEKCSEKIKYSDRYSDDDWEYRHVTIPREMVKYFPAGICSEKEWRGMGVRQSPGWEMYMRHEPEPHVLLFRRPKNYDAVHPVLGESFINRS